MSGKREEDRISVRPPGSLPADAIDQASHTMAGIVGESALNTGDRISFRPPGSLKGEAIDQGSHTIADPSHVTPQAPLPKDLAGQHVGRVIAGKYRILARVGAGGMGEVYRAEHLSLRMPVAVKLLHHALAIVPDHVRRFYREARAVTQLNHPHVVRVLDFGDDNGLPYLVMEWLDGETLHSYLRNRTSAPPLSEVQEIMLQVLSAFEAAHAHGIVHRDVKPENIFLTEVLGKRTVKILDFGLAHVEVPREDDAGPTLTKPDTVGGTPEYMSPEQCHSLAVGPASDIYALGCVLTAMLQGRPPFSGRNSIDIISAHLFLPPPALVRPTDAEPIPVLLDRLRQQMLSKQPEKRPATAEEVRLGLLAALDPASRATELITRKGNEPLGARAQRIPQWEESEAHKTNRDAGPELHEVALFRLGNESGIDQTCITGLAAQGLHLKATAKREELFAQNAKVLVLDAGENLAGAIELLGTLRIKAPDTKAIVCAKGLVPERMTKLVSAGAADMLGAPASTDVLARKVWRVLRRGR